MEHRFETLTMQVRRSGARRAHDHVDRLHEREQTSPEPIPVGEQPDGLPAGQLFPCPVAARDVERVRTDAF
jgi:hypothetical protein